MLLQYYLLFTILFNLRSFMQAEYKQFKYKVINLQKLDRKNQTGTTPTNINHFVKKLDPPT